MKKILIVTVTLLFFGVVLSSSILAGNIARNIQLQPLFSGDILYVGGSGPNNYTNIQDAIDNASDGDTVFVYDDSSPYYENLLIEKQINLLGEDKNTTVIDGGSHPGRNIVKIQFTDYVKISGFTTQKGWGFYIYSNYSIISGNNIGPHTESIGLYVEGYGCVIENNVISSNKDGIWLWYGGENCLINNIIISNGEFGIFAFRDNNNYFIRNIISNHSTYGLYIFNSNNLNISQNTISYNDHGLYIQESKENFISKNVITSNERNGVWFTPDCIHNIVSDNVISYNQHGIEQSGLYQFWRLKKHVSNLHITNNEIINNDHGVVIGTNGNIVSYNNFKNNSEQAYFYQSLQNEWNENYWSDSQDMSYMIKGRIGFIFKLIPWVNYDYNPAHKPYDIGG